MFNGRICPTDVKRLVGIIKDKLPTDGEQKFTLTFGMDMAEPKTGLNASEVASLLEAISGAVSKFNSEQLFNFKLGTYFENNAEQTFVEEVTEAHKAATELVRSANEASKIILPK